MAAKPTDDTIALIAFLRGAYEWHYADEIRHAIPELGFEMPSSQWVAGRLTAMTKEDAPRFVSLDRNGVAVYQVTRYAENAVTKAWRGFNDRRRPYGVMR